MGPHGGFWKRLTRATTFRTRKRRIGHVPADVAVVRPRRRDRAKPSLWKLYGPNALYLALTVRFWFRMEGADLPTVTVLAMLAVAGLGLMIRALGSAASGPHRLAAAFIAAPGALSIMVAAALLDL